MVVLNRGITLELKKEVYIMKVVEYHGLQVMKKLSKVTGHPISDPLEILKSPIIVEAVGTIAEEWEDTPAEILRFINAALPHPEIARCTRLIGMGRCPKVRARPRSAA